MALSSALSTTTLKQARSDLQARVNEVAPDKFSPEELNFWIDKAQSEVFVRLSAISDIWYGIFISMTTPVAAVGGVTKIDLTTTDAKPSDIAKIKQVVLTLINSVTKQTYVPFVEFSVLYSLPLNSNYDKAYRVSWFGEDLFLFVGTSATALVSTDTLDLFFIRKPIAISADADTVDVPSEFYELLILAALSKAVGKLRLMDVKAGIDQDVSRMFADIRAMYGQEIQQMAIESAPGTQTPRLR